MITYDEKLYKLNNSLIEACKSGDFNKIKKLIKRGANVSTGDGLPVYFSCQSGNIDIVKYLLAKDIEKNRNNIERNRNKIGSYRLSAKKSGNLNIVEFLDEFIVVYEQ